MTSSTALMTCKAAAAQDASKLARSQLPLLSPSPAKEPMFRLWPGEGEVSAESGGHAQRGSARDGYSLNEPALGRVGRWAVLSSFGINVTVIVKIFP